MILAIYFIVGISFQYKIEAGVPVSIVLYFTRFNTYSPVVSGNHPAHSSRTEKKKGKTEKILHHHHTPHPPTMSQQVSLTYQVASADNVPAILSLVRSAYRGDASRAGWTTEADLVMDERIDATGVLAKINEPNSAILLAHDDAGGLAACCELLKRDAETAYFGLFAVDPLRQAGGIGRQVLTEAEAYAKKVFGVAKLDMSVIWLREELISWYIRRGYKKTEERRPFPYDQLVNGKALRDDLYFSVLVKDL